MAGWGGQLLMLPVQLFIEVPGYYPDRFEKFGLKVPEIFDEFMDLLEGWQEQERGASPAYVPFVSSDPLQEMVMLVSSLYAGQCLATQEAFSFDSPELLRMMKRVDDLLKKKPRIFQSGTPLMELRTANLGPAMQLYGSSMSDFTGEPISLKPLSLKPREDIPMAILGDAWVMMIPQSSQNPALAIRLLEEFTKAMEMEVKAKVMPGLNQQIEALGFRETWAAMEERLKNLEDQAQAAEGAEKSQAEKEAENYRQHMENYEKNNRFSVTPDTLAEYRAMAENLRVQRFGQPDSFFVFNNSPAITLLLQYSGGLINLDQFLQQSHQRLKLMAMEDE